MRTTSIVQGAGLVANQASPMQNEKQSDGIGVYKPVGHPHLPTEVLIPYILNAMKPR